MIGIETMQHNTLVTKCTLVFGIIGMLILSATVTHHNQVQLKIINTKLRIIDLLSVPTNISPQYHLAGVVSSPARCANEPAIIAQVVDKHTVPSPPVQTSHPRKSIWIGKIQYTAKQQELLEIAYIKGSRVGFPETIQALLLQETRAGLFGDGIGDTTLEVGRRSYGVMQMKVGTTRMVLKKHKSLILKYFPRRKTYNRLRDEDIIIKSVLDDTFNIHMASLKFKMHRERSKTWAQAVVAYNRGQRASTRIGNHTTHKYFKDIRHKVLNEVRPFNDKINIATMVNL